MDGMFLCSSIHTVMPCSTGQVGVNGKKEAFQVRAVPFLLLMNTTKLYMTEKNRHSKGIRKKIDT